MKHFISLFASILLSALCLTWFSQNAVNAYWQQTYHTDSPIQALSAYTWWQQGAELQTRAYAFADGIKAALNGTTNTDDNTAQQEMPSETAASAIAADIPVIPETAVIQSGDKVFFAGDSLMQGVAPFVQKSLKQQYGIESVNLSKQSTGLSYPSFFDWPKTIENTLKQQPDIRLLVVFLGPNDPWDFSVGGKRLKFAETEWAEEYLKRVNRILTAAHQHNVQVIWLGIPYMKKDKLNTQMRYLDRLLSDALHDKVVWIPTDRTLSNGEDIYRDSVNIDGKIIRYRSKDGIHFTAEGQKLLAGKIMEKIVFKQVEHP